MQRIVGLDKISHSGDRILILGSMPSIRSMEERFYYANPTNRFWAVLSEIYGYPVKTKEERLIVLKQAHISLWDICHSCIRKKSADATIRDVEANDVLGLLREVPSIETIVCNGKTSYNTVKRYIPELADRVYVCPSTSSANARYRLSDLVREYRKCLGK